MCIRDSYKGAAAYNKRLSQKRAEAVVAYLIDHGIASDRLTPKGYGKERPKTIKKKLTEKLTWLKEGDVLTEVFIKAIKDEKKREICNQLNRRTEFSVLRLSLIHIYCVFTPYLRSAFTAICPISCFGNLLTK